MIGVLSLFHAADGRCCYCDCETWVPGRIRRHLVFRQFGITPRSHGSAKTLRRFQATREHLVRTADGGGSCESNLALSCAWCNSARGESTPEQHRENIARAIAAGLHPNHPPPADLSKAGMRRARKEIGLSPYAMTEAASVG